MTNRIPIDTSDPEIKELWRAALRAAREVDDWPAWKHTEQPAVAEAERLRGVMQRAIDDVKRDRELQQWRAVWSEP